MTNRPKAWLRYNALIKDDPKLYAIFVESLSDKIKDYYELFLIDLKNTALELNLNVFKYIIENIQIPKVMLSEIYEQIRKECYYIWLPHEKRYVYTIKLYRKILTLFELLSKYVPLSNKKLRECYLKNHCAPFVDVAFFKPYVRQLYFSKDEEDQTFIRLNLLSWLALNEWDSELFYIWVELDSNDADQCISMYNTQLNHYLYKYYAYDKYYLLSENVSKDSCHHFGAMYRKYKDTFDNWNNWRLRIIKKSLNSDERNRKNLNELLDLEQLSSIIISFLVIY